MSGAVDWQTLIWIVTVVSAAIGGTATLVARSFMAITRVRDEISDSRHTLRNELQASISHTQGQVMLKADKDDLEALRDRVDRYINGSEARSK